MKKRIAAMLLALVMVCNIAGNAKPAKAEAVAATTVALTYLVYNLYSVMTGRWDDCAEALGCVLENGVEGFEKAFVGTEDTPSWFVTGWNQISKTVAGWFDDGTIELSEDGKVYMNYYNYLELCNIMYDYVDLSLELGSSVYHKLLSVPFDNPILLKKIPKPNCFYTSDGCSYVPVYYSDSAIYFSRVYFGGYELLLSAKFGIRIPPFNAFENKIGAEKFATISGDYSSYIYFSSADHTLFFHYNLYYGPQYYSGVSNDWYQYDAYGKSTIAYDAVDTSLNQGYLVISGDLDSFLDTVTGITTSPDTSQVDDLSDALDDLLVLNPDPGLVVDTDPTIEIPTDAILITDITGVEDMTLTDALEDVKPRLDLEIPTSIWNKFPFSLPFDFYRLLTIFVAEPKAPVFRIPISNVNVDMNAYKDNQTFGDYLNSDSDLMFEIDEEIVIDLSGLPFIQAISYTCFIVGWVALLIFATSKLIHH